MPNNQFKTVGLGETKLLLLSYQSTAVCSGSFLALKLFRLYPALFFLSNADTIPSYLLCGALDKIYNSSRVLGVTCTDRQL